MAVHDHLGVRLWFFLLLTLVSIQSGFAILCWECNSHYDRNCGDPFRNYSFALTDCDQRSLENFPHTKASVCRKIIQKVRDDYRFVRGCGWIGAEKENIDCFKRAGTFNVLIQYCSCTGEDGCNSAPNIGLWMGPATLLLALLVTAI